ncbi:MAG: transposase [Bacteroidales bacterium]|nr:transposase [Bacteroidales bacterium]
MIVDSLHHCQKEKGLEIYGWCLMPSHLHLICSVSSEIGMSGFLRDLKKFTSKEIVKLVVETPESRREWILKQFESAYKLLKCNQKYKVW